MADQTPAEIAEKILAYIRSGSTTISSWAANSVATAYLQMIAELKWHERNSKELNAGEMARMIIERLEKK